MTTIRYSKKKQIPILKIFTILSCFGLGIIISHTTSKMTDINENKHVAPGAGFHPVYVYYGSDQSINNLVAIKGQSGSQVDQDKIIAALIKKEPNNFSPYFVDLAANDALYLSNTFLLETLGWKGLCIEPNPIYWYRLAHRKCDIAASFVGGKQDMQQVEVAFKDVFSGIISKDMDNKPRKDQNQEKRYTVSLATVFKEFNVPITIDYMSLDVEGAEMLVMQDFPFETHTIKYMTIERPRPELQALLKQHGYKFVEMLVYWGDTLWVHESVKMSMDDILKIVKEQSSYVSKLPAIGQIYFDMETGFFGPKA